MSDIEAFQFYCIIYLFLYFDFRKTKNQKSN
jgi:hypothetical protein